MVKKLLEPNKWLSNSLLVSVQNDLYSRRDMQYTDIKKINGTFGKYI